MRFANYKYTGKNINNLGDHIQIITIDYLYNTMGIKKEEIIYIDKDNLSTYNGEPVLLPVSMPLIDYKENGIAGLFSEKITPVFFGLTMAKDELLPEEITYLKKYEPIGCRDERTYNTLIDLGINAYLGGCLTVTLPTRNSNPDKQNKVFIIDPTKGIKNYIPEEISKNAVYDTHIIYDYLENPTITAEERFNQYHDEAKLIITSLLHCSVPCMAMGIPVILAKDMVSYRFGWLEALLNIYTPAEYDKINWNPAPIEYNEHKIRIIDLFRKRMKSQDSIKDIIQIHDFYMNRNKNNYIIDAFISIQEFIDKTWIDKEKNYKYAVWGLTQMADMTVSYISKHYPNAKLIHIYDLQVGLKFKYKEEVFSAIHPDNISNYPEETVFVTTVGAAKSAKEYFNRINKGEYMYKILEVIV